MEERTRAVNEKKKEGAIGSEERSRRLLKVMNLYLCVRGHCGFIIASVFFWWLRNA